MKSSEEDIPDLPEGYKERMDSCASNMMPHAKRAWEIVEEFCAEDLLLTYGEIEVIIRKKSDG